MDVRRVEALVFDVFGTVVDWRSSIIEQFRAFGRENGLSVNWEAFVDDWKSCYRPGMDAVRDGRWPWTNVDGIYRKKLDALLGEYGITGLSDAETIRLNRAWHRCKPWPDVVAGLTRLKANYVLSTLSNGDVACLVNMAKYGGLPWDCILCAELFRHYKPDPQVGHAHDVPQAQRRAQHLLHRACAACARLGLVGGRAWARSPAVGRRAHAGRARVAVVCQLSRAGGGEVTGQV